VVNGRFETAAKLILVKELTVEFSQELECASETCQGEGIVTFLGIET
jgi:hypothetical protein